MTSRSDQATAAIAWLLLLLIAVVMAGLLVRAAVWAWSV